MRMRQISLPGVMCGEDATGQGAQGQWGEIVGEPEHQDKDEVVFLVDWPGSSGKPSKPPEHQ